MRNKQVIVKNLLCAVREAYKAFTNAFSYGKTTQELFSTFQDPLKISLGDRNIWDSSKENPDIRRVWDRKIFHFEEWQTVFHQDMGSIVVDPRFRDPLHFDFTLAENSPAKKLGFKALTGFFATGKKE